jgi:rod shape-determining protein MreC
MEQVRFGLQTAMYPLQLAVSSPGTAWTWVRDSARTRERLRAENTELRTRLRDLELRTMRYEALSQENATIRGLREALPPVAEKWLVAEVVRDVDNLRPRVIINRGTTNGVFKGQAVMDDSGILGQTTHVGPWSAEVILITDPEHQIPVEIERTGLRTIAEGRDDGALGLPYLPTNADIQVGDMLITSGMGGVFPQGYPVAKVVALNRASVQPLQHVTAQPFATIDRNREVMLVWFRDTHPATPVPDTSGDLTKGDANVQPQPAPPKPAASAAGAGSAASAAGADGKPGASGSARPSAGGNAKPGTATTNSAPRTGTGAASAPRQTAGPRGTVPVPASSGAPATRSGGASANPNTPSGAARTPTAAPRLTAPPQPTTPPAENR